MMNTDIKKLIELKALELIKAQGVRSVSMDHIARKAGVSKKTVYIYFNNKEEIIKAAITDLLHENRNEFMTIVNQPGDPVNKIAKLYHYSLLQIRDYHPGTQFTIDKYYTEAAQEIDQYRKWMMFDVIAGLMKEAKEKGLMRDDVDIDLSCNIQYGLHAELLNGEFNLLLVQRFNAFFDHYVMNFLRGLLTPKGYEILKKQQPL